MADSSGAVFFFGCVSCMALLPPVCIAAALVLRRLPEGRPILAIVLSSGAALGTLAAFIRLFGTRVNGAQAAETARAAWTIAWQTGSYFYLGFGLGSFISLVFAASIYSLFQHLPTGTES